MWSVIRRNLLFVLLAMSNVLYAADSLAAISCWGDSLTPQYAQALRSVLFEKGNRRVVNDFGIGRQTSSQVKGRFLKAPAHFGDIAIIWVGRNNFWSAGDVKKDIAEMVGKLTTDRYLVLSILTSAANKEHEFKDHDWWRPITSLNRELAALYPGHYVVCQSSFRRRICLGAA